MTQNYPDLFRFVQFCLDFQDTGVDPFPLVNGQFMYKGIRYPAFVVKEKLETLMDMDFKEDDWLVVSYPKSG